MCCVSALNQLDEWFYKLWGEKQRTFILLKEVLSNVCRMNLKKGYCWHTLSLLNRFGSIRVQLNPITVISVTLQLVFWLQIICRVTLIIQTIYNSATTFNARFKKNQQQPKKTPISFTVNLLIPRGSGLLTLDKLLALYKWLSVKSLLWFLWPKTGPCIMLQRREATYLNQKQGVLFSAPLAQELIHL